MGDDGIFPDYAAGTAVPGRATAVYGNYVLQAKPANGLNYPRLQIYEAARPRALHSVGIGDTPGGKAEIGPGFAYSVGGAVFDLLANPPTAVGSGSSTETCTYDGVRVDDVMVAGSFTSALVGSGSGVLRVTPLETATDRNPSTIYSIGAYSTSLNAGAGNRPQAIKLFGNRLVVVETRTTGLWLKIYDASDLRSGQPNRVLSDTRKIIPDLQLFSCATSASTRVASLDIAPEGVAAIAVTDPFNCSGVWMVDLSDALDDDPATIFDATDIEGRVTAISHTVGSTSFINSWLRYAVIRNRRVWVLTYNTIDSFDATVAFDRTPGTDLPLTVPTLGFATLPMSSAYSFTVYGSYAFVAPYGPGSSDPNMGVMAVDLSGLLDADPATGAVLLGSYPYRPLWEQCSIPGEGSNALANRGISISVQGSRAYVSTGQELQILELE
jgi:hypothetical protein